jgi:type IV pilus assembly protein PilO
MATKTKRTSANVDLTRSMQRLNAQFQGLDIRKPASWPAIPRYVLLVFIAVAVLAVGWVFLVRSASDELNAAHAQETTLRDDYTKKIQQAVVLDRLKEQKEQVAQYVESLEKQLPPKSEMDALLSDINQAGLNRGLQFDSFKPGTIVIRNYYAELPIAIKVTGSYHNIGEFTADVAGLSRIVTLNDLNLAPTDKTHPGQLTLSTTARTYRYLDPEEIQAAAQAASRTKGGKK